jgi:hypothetical protein
MFENTVLFSVMTDVTVLEAVELALTDMAVLDDATELGIVDTAAEDIETAYG